MREVSLACNLDRDYDRDNGDFPLALGLSNARR